MPDFAMTSLSQLIMCRFGDEDQSEVIIDPVKFAELVQDGFSDSEASSDEDQENINYLSKSTQDGLKSERKVAQNLRLKNGYNERKPQGKLYRSYSTGTGEKSTHQNAHHKPHKHEHKGDHKGEQRVEHKTEHKIQYQHHNHHHHGDKRKHHNNTHHHKSPHHHHSNADRSKSVPNTPETSKPPFTFDVNEYMPIITGQNQDDVNVPIMTSPPLEENSPNTFSMNSRIRPKSSYYAKCMTYKLLLAGERLPCSFYEDDKSKERKLLLDTSHIDECFCSSSGTLEEGFYGWDVPQRCGKSKSVRRRKSVKPSEPSRLHQTMGKDPVLFHHYNDSLKYIERYRFFHTIGNVGRAPTYNAFSEKTPDNDPYYSKVKSNLRAIQSPYRDFPYDLLPQQYMTKYSGSASSIRSDACDLHHSEADDDPDSNIDTRLYSVKDRGKALNLAPVREYTVPNFRTTEKIDISQLHHYLNLSVPPVPNNCLQLELDESQMRRVGHRVANTGDNLFPRRGARPLRLGSAEFIKPGSADLDARWSERQRNTNAQRASAFSAPGPGNLIVGSTVTPHSTSQTARSKSGQQTATGKSSPYIQYQKEQLQKQSVRPPSPPQRVSGQKVKTCERANESSSASKERHGKFMYTHALYNDKPSPVQTIRTATVMDLRDVFPIHPRHNPLTLDVNHLGIRGTPLKQSEELALYKNRRAASIRS